MIQCDCMELIDTLWNVNKGAKLDVKKAKRGINRYIMECKSTYTC